MFKPLFSLKDNSSRSAIIDSWRGFAMLLVMLQHNGGLHEVVSLSILQFHMPLFFIISGFMLDRAYSLRKHSFGHHIAKRFVQLIVPYFIFELIFLAAWLIYQGAAVNVKATLLSIVTVVNSDEASGLRLWFLPCLFVADCAAFFVLRYINRKIQLFIISIFVYAAAWWFSIVHPGRLPFMLDIGLVAFVYIIIGYMLAHFLFNLEKGKISKYLICAAILLLGVCIVCSQNNSPFLMYSHNYGNYAISFVGACCGSIASLILVSYSIRRSKWLTTFVSWFGRNSLLLFPLHLLVLNTMAAVQSVIHIPLGLRFFILVGICIPLANLITRYLPVLAGRGLFPRALKKDSCIPS